jgi:hypothetical protein
MGAIERHLFSWWDGEDMTRDSKIHHLKAIAADVGLMLDAMAKGTFVDDRPTSGGAADLLQDWEDRIGRARELDRGGVDRPSVAELQTKPVSTYYSGGCSILASDAQYASDTIRGYDLGAVGSRRQVLD